MTIQKDDPRLTAYTLGEMSDAEADEFEKTLASDPAARAEVDSIRDLGERLQGALEGVDEPLLDVQRREALAAATGRPKRSPWRWVGVVGAVAAGFVVLAVGVSLMVPNLRARRYLASDEVRGMAPGASVMDELSIRSGDEVEELERAPDAPFDTEGYDRIRDNPFFRTSDRDVSTFSIDVDTASYSNVRRFLDQMGRLPPKDAVRIEELINYFPYAYEPPADDAEEPFAFRALVTGCPWAPSHRLVRVAIQGKTMTVEERPPANLVFLLDVSGSMNHPNKLPLLKQAMKLLVDRLDARDRVAIAVYAGAAGLVLPSTEGGEKPQILAALDRLAAGGSTNGGAGIQLAYRTAKDGFIEGGVNRVILCTDGDFNVGVSDRGSLTRLIEEEAKSGVFLTILGFGSGNYKDASMEQLSNVGNGNYAYVDTLREARKVLVDEGLGTLVTIAKDVKIQVFFNPKEVQGWRLIGYENRVLRAEDFNDDTKDAGDIGAGHQVTALYEIVPAGGDMPAVPGVDPNPFVEPPRTPGAGEVPEEADPIDLGALLRLRLRYKLPDGEVSTLLEEDVVDEDLAFEDADVDLHWAAAVAGFGMLLRDSPHKGDTSWAFVEEVARAARGEDDQGYRAEFLQLLRLASALADE